MPHLVRTCHHCDKLVDDGDTFYEPCFQKVTAKDRIDDWYMVCGNCNYKLMYKSQGSKDGVMFREHIAPMYTKCQSCNSTDWKKKCKIRGLTVNW